MASRASEGDVLGDGELGRCSGDAGPLASGLDVAVVISGIFLTCLLSPVPFGFTTSG